MRRKPKLESIDEREATVSRLVRRVRRKRAPLVITERGRASAVLQSLAAYERAAEEREILLALARGEREIRAGKGTSLTRILAETRKVFHRTQR